MDLVIGDILDLDLTPFLSPGPVRVAGNLPYNISSPIMFKLLATARTSPGLQDATVMLQLEVAERLAASPGTKDFGGTPLLFTRRKPAPMARYRMRP